MIHLDIHFLYDKNLYLFFNIIQSITYMIDCENLIIKVQDSSEFTL